MNDKFAVVYCPSAMSYGYEQIALFRLSDEERLIENINFSASDFCDKHQASLYYKLLLKAIEDEDENNIAIYWALITLNDEFKEYDITKDDITTLLMEATL